MRLETDAVLLDATLGRGKPLGTVPSGTTFKVTVAYPGWIHVQTSSGEDGFFATEGLAATVV